MGTGSFLWVKCGRDVTLTTHRLLVKWSRRSKAILTFPLWAVRPVRNLNACTVQLYIYCPMGRTACTEPQCLYSTAKPLFPLWTVRPVQSLNACTVQLYLYSPYGPYGLYRASVPVQYSYNSIPPMVRTACTEPQCLYSISIPPMDRTACTEPQCLYSTPIPLFPLRTVRPVQRLSACTVQLYLNSPYGPYNLYRASVPVQYSYTSTPPMGRTACTEPQCLYKCALYIYIYIYIYI